MMQRSTLFARGIALSAMMVVIAGPAAAEGKADRARAAIAAAAGKVDTASKLGTGGELPRMTAAAAAALASAREDLATGHKDEAIADANHAAQLADTAIGEAQRMRVGAEQQQRAEAQSSAANAQQDAAAANARADAAQQSAAASAAEATALRNAPPPAPVLVQVPAPAPTTTVTTVEKSTHVAARPSHARKRIVRVRSTHRPRAATVSEKTTVTTTSN